MIKCVILLTASLLSNPEHWQFPASHSEGSRYYQERTIEVAERMCQRIHKEAKQ